jgi:hypothetical protein
MEHSMIDPPCHKCGRLVNFTNLMVAHDDPNGYAHYCKSCASKMKESDDVICAGCHEGIRGGRDRHHARVLAVRLHGDVYLIFCPACKEKVKARGYISFCTSCNTSLLESVFRPSKEVPDAYGNFCIPCAGREYPGVDELHTKCHECGKVFDDPIKMAIPVPGHDRLYYIECLRCRFDGLKGAFYFDGEEAAYEFLSGNVSVFESLEHDPELRSPGGKSRVTTIGKDMIVEAAGQFFVYHGSR